VPASLDRDRQHAGAFAVADWGFSKVPQQFFPDSTRPELLVDLRLPEGSLAHARRSRFEKRLEAFLAKQPGVENYVAYVGTGSPRFYLPLDQQLPQANFAQFVILADDIAKRARRCATRLIELFRNDFPDLRGRRSPPGERPAGGLSGAVPGERAGHSDGAHRRGGGRGDAHQPTTCRMCKRTGTSLQGGRVGVDHQKARLLGLSRQDVAELPPPP
jgi:multidrug efflux pump